jgi:sulfur carrier protein
LRACWRNNRGQNRRAPLPQSIEPYSNTMDIHINQKLLSLPEGATVADALAAFGARPPFAVALNGDFVARTQHAARALQPGDKLDVVQPVAGG